MRPYVSILILLVLIPTARALAQHGITRKTELTERTYLSILESLQEPPFETYWKEIPWRPNFTEAIEDARKEDKPILLWMMNGHPCGMT